MIESTPWDMIELGSGAATARLVSRDDLTLFSRLTGTFDPSTVTTDVVQADGSPLAGAVPAFLLAAIASAGVANRIPGPGSVWRSVELTFHEPVTADEEFVTSVTVRAKHDDGTVTVGLRVVKVDGALVAEGRGLVAPPAQTIRLPHGDLPDVTIDRHVALDRLISVARRLPPTRTAVVQPDDAASLGGALEAWKAGLIVPILVGNRARIEACAAALRFDLAAANIEIADAGDDHAAATRAVALVHEGRVGALMKGHLHTDILLHHMVKREGGLRTTRRFSHAFVLDVPGRSRPLLISDAAINIAPDLDAKVHIVQNAIDLARAIGLAVPRVGILSAVETVSAAIPSTIDAAVLSKMADRGQIRGGIVDGPLAMDIAVDAEAAAAKGVTSPVAGHADVLIAPNLEAGNMLAKQLVYLASATTSGLVVGARVPVMLTSRSDDERARLGSAALAQLYGHFLATGASLIVDDETA